jgi:predicted nucleic acid-binding protein
MPWLADTTILLRFSNVDDPQHLLVRGAIEVLLEQGERLHYTQQNRREFWNVCTRPVAANGWGYTVEQTQQALAEVDAAFQRLPDRAESGPEWDRLVAHYEVIGRQVHDAQLVAAMLVNEITHILTLNDADFHRYDEITAVHPQDVVPPPPAPG